MIERIKKNRFIKTKNDLKSFEQTLLNMKDLEKKIWFFSLNEQVLKQNKKGHFLLNNLFFRTDF